MKRKKITQCLIFFLFLKIPQTTRKRNLLALKKNPKSPKNGFIIWNSQKVRAGIHLLKCVFWHWVSWGTVTLVQHWALAACFRFWVGGLGSLVIALQHLGAKGSVSPCWLARNLVKVQIWVQRCLEQPKGSFRLSRSCVGRERKSVFWLEEMVMLRS